MKDAVALAYGDSTKSNVQNKQDGLQCDSDWLRMSSEKWGAYDNVFRVMVGVEMTGEEDEPTGIYEWPDQSINTPIKKEQDKKSA